MFFFVLAFLAKLILEDRQGNPPEGAVVVGREKSLEVFNRNRFP